jgi:catechol 2,3-dioxygenase
MELFWEVDYAATPPGEATALRNRPQRRPRRGVPVRRIDHLNVMTADTAAVRDFMTGALGFRERERVEVDGGGPVIASWLSVTNLTHDIALIPEPTSARGRFHHVAYHYLAAQHLYDVAELAREAGVTIEFGPGRHGIGGATFLYMIEPGGHRVEVMGDAGYLIFDPCWRPAVWKTSELAAAVAWSGSAPPDSFWLPGVAPDAAARAPAA